MGLMKRRDEIKKMHLKREKREKLREIKNERKEKWNDDE